MSRNYGTYRAGLVHLARANRRNATPTESIMWERLRDRRLGGFKFYRQRVIKDAIVDFYNSDALLIVEIDGEAHCNADRQESDALRDIGMAILGYRTIRFNNSNVLLYPDVVCNSILDAIYESIEEQRSA